MIQEMDMSSMVYDRSTTGRFDAEKTTPMNNTLKLLKANPDQIELTLLDLRRKHIENGGIYLRPMTDLYATAIFIDNYLQSPLMEASTYLYGKDKDYVLKMNNGVGIVTSSIIRGERALMHGVKNQVEAEIKNEQAISNLPEVSSESLGLMKQSTLRDLAAKVALLNEDPTSGKLLNKAYFDVLNMAKGIDPINRRRDKRLKQEFDENSIRGAVFALEIFRIVYPLSKALFPRPVVSAENE